MYLGTRPSSARVKSHLYSQRDILGKRDRSFPKVSELIVLIIYKEPFWLLIFFGALLVRPNVSVRDRGEGLILPLDVLFYVHFSKAVSFDTGFYP